MNVKFYMQKEGGELIDLEAHFAGLRYQKCTGLNDKGKRKNIYKETYSDSDTVRVWQGAEVTREATTITFTFFFFGANRQSVYTAFYDYVKNGEITYYDTARKKKALLVLSEAITVSNDVWKGSKPYIEASFKFDNLWGECRDVE